MKVFSFLYFILCFFSTDLVAEDLTIKITGLRSNNGQIMIALYNKEDEWLDFDKAVSQTKQKLKDKNFVVTYKNLEQGYYGIAVYHDENMDGELNFSFFPPGPSEGVGFSRISKMGFGRPSWSDTNFKLDHDLEIEIATINP